MSKKMKITLPDDTEISSEDFIKSIPTDMITNEIDEAILGKLRELSNVKEGELPESSNFGIPIDKALTDENQNKEDE